MPPQQRGKELTPGLRSRICEGKALSLSYTQLAYHHQLSKNTIIATIHTEQKRNENQESLPRSSVPRIIDEVVCDKLVSKAYFEDICITWTALTEYAKIESKQELYQYSV
jgi:hypothetical protein